LKKQVNSMSGVLRNGTLGFWRVFVMELEDIAAAQIWLPNLRLGHKYRATLP
jgi:hypothetical protein